MVLARDGDLLLRRAAAADVQLLVALARDPAVEPFLAATGSYSEAELAAEVARSLAEPERYGRLVAELTEGEAVRPAGALAYEVANVRSRIAYLHAVVVAPDLRGRGLGARASRLAARLLLRELGYHRVQLEVYGFNLAAQRTFERAGFVLEGRRRRAYWRHGEWHDGVIFGLLDDELDD